LGWGADGPDRTAVGLEGVAWPETCGRWWDEVDKKRMIVRVRLMATR